ncbi:MAG TPA: hypothetical protein PKE30_17670, partial [Niabella sp.]|nr:hypothetical protein [Niabella sp.]
IEDCGAKEYKLPAIPPSANYLADGLSFSGPYFSTFVYGGSTAIVVGSYAMAAIQPAPGGMLYGEVRTKVFFENSNKFSDRHYVNRHYQVGPVTEIIGNTSPVAKLTLYFTQEEFDAYNAAVGTKADHLPTGPNDDANIASIRIHQFYGSSTNGTGLPGTYENGLRIIDPEDMDIKWHFARNLEPGYWSVSFNVYRFSGFFVFADGSALPVHFGDITAAVSDNRLSVNWTTLTETGNDHFEIEASVDGVNFVTIGSAKSLADSGNSSTVLKYSFSASLNDLLPGVSVAVILLFSAFPFKEKKRRKILLLSAFASLLLVFACEKKEVQPVAPESVLFVRIKQVDKDGSFEYSKTIQVVKE